MEAALSPGWVYQVLLAPGGEKFECDLYKTYLYLQGGASGRTPRMGEQMFVLIYHLTLSHLLLCGDLLKHIELGLEWLGW